MLHVTQIVTNADKRINLLISDLFAWEYLSQQPFSLGFTLTPYREMEHLRLLVPSDQRKEIVLHDMSGPSCICFIGVVTFQSFNS